MEPDDNDQGVYLADDRLRLFPNSSLSCSKFNNNLMQVFATILYLTLLSARLTRVGVRTARSIRFPSRKPNHVTSLRSKIRRFMTRVINLVINLRSGLKVLYTFLLMQALPLGRQRFCERDSFELCQCHRVYQLIYTCDDSLRRERRVTK